MSNVRVRAFEKKLLIIIHLYSDRILKLPLIIKKKSTKKKSMFKERHRVERTQNLGRLLLYPIRH